MTIVELRDRLTEIINDNERRGWTERNASQISVKMPISKRIKEYRFVKYALGGWWGFRINSTSVSDLNCFVLEVEDKPFWDNRNKKRG